MHMLPVLILAGAQGVGKSALASRLLLHQQQPHAASDPRCWAIDTKYYTASVALHELSLPPAPPQQQQQQPEALLLVVDAQHAASMDAARAWAEASPALLEAAEIRLLLANKADLLAAQPHGQRPQWLQDCMDWCAASGFEYIEVCASDAELDARLQLDGEAQGMARVVDALHAHMWPGMAMKDRGGGGGANGNGSGRPAAAAEVTAADTGASAERVQNGGQHSGDTVLETQARDGDGGAAHANGHAKAARGPRPCGDRLQAPGPDSAADPSPPGLVPSASCSGGSQPEVQQAAGPEGRVAGSRGEGPAVAQAAGVRGPSVAEAETDDDVQEKQLEAFEKIFTEMQGAKQRLAGLPDHQRRSEAAEIALRLASMLGLDSEEDEEEEEN